MTVFDTLAPEQGVLALEEWEQPPRRRPGPNAPPVLAVEGFEGPLDWLLDLARTRRIDLARLSIVALVEAFEEGLTAALATPNLQPTLLGRWGDWLVMAAELTLLRSRLLVPADAAAAQDAHDEAERLRKHLLGRAEISRAADWLEGREQLGRDVFTRGQADGAGVVRAGRTGDITALLRAYLVAIRLPAEAGALYRVPGAAVLECSQRGRTDPGHAAAERARLWRRSCPRCRAMRRSGGAMPGSGGGDLPGRARTDTRRQYGRRAGQGLGGDSSRGRAGNIPALANRVIR